MQMFLVPTKDIADPDRETPDEVSSMARSNEDLDLEVALTEIKEAKSQDDLQDIVNRWGGKYKNNAQFKAAGTKRWQELAQ